MLLREVEYARPATVEEAISLLAAHDGARALAGGQTLVNVMKQRAAAPDVLVDLADLDELRAIGFSADGMLEIGAMVTYAQLQGSSEVDVARPILAEVAATIARRPGPEPRHDRRQRLRRATRRTTSRRSSSPSTRRSRSAGGTASGRSRRTSSSSACT